MISSPRVGVDVNRGKIDTEDLVVSDEIGSDLLSVSVGIDLNPVRCRGAVKPFQSDLHEMFWIDALHVHRHFLYPNLRR